MRRHAFSMLELVFVIVVVGILAKFGADIFRSSYDAYIINSITNQLQANTEAAVQQVANRLQYRIRNSVIERIGTTATYRGLSGGGGVAGYNTLEWIGYDIDGWRGDDNGDFTAPLWSGFVDIEGATSTAQLDSPGTDLGALSTMINSLSPTGSGVNDAAIFFTGAPSNVLNDYGWNGVAQTGLQSTTAAHHIRTDGTVNTIFPNNAAVSNFSGVDIYEQYKLAWTAYALRLDANGDLWLHFDYQPWQGDSLANAAQELLLDNVSSFRFQAVGDMVKIQICQEPSVGNQGIFGGDFAICKEKAVF